LGASSGGTAVLARKVAGKFLHGYSKPVFDWSIAAIASGFEASLRRLNTEKVDLLFLHEPVHGAVQSDELLAWLQNERAKGTIRAWGLAGDAHAMTPWLSPHHALSMVLQIRDSLDHREADAVAAHGRDFQITYGYISSSGRGGVAASPVNIVDLALARNVTGSVLVSTRRPAHLIELARTA
jgi:aryl-alcohol dehydrogenase-like predicted oxidoreductase